MERMKQLMNDRLSISKIALTNFRQHGSLEIPLSNLNVIIGENGGGKTSILEGICYGLFGAVANGATKKELIKMGEKTGGICITFSNGYKIVRDFATTSKLLDDKDRLLTDKSTEIESFLKIDKNIFLNILYAAQNDIYSYFIKFNAKEKDFLDNLFNLTNITDITTSFLKDTQNTINSHFNVVMQAKETKERLQKHINDTLQSLQVSSIDDLSNALINLRELVDKYKQSYNAYQTNKDTLSIIDRYKANRDAITNSIQTFSNRVENNKIIIENARNNFTMYLTEASKTLNMNINPEKLDEFYKEMEVKSDITTYLNSIIMMAQKGITNPSSDLFTGILNACQVIMQIDQYRNYYMKIANDLNNLSAKVSSLYNQQCYDDSEYQRLQTELQKVNNSIIQLENTIDQYTLNEDDSNIAQMYLQYQSQYSNLDATYRSLQSYNKELEIIDSKRPHLGGESDHVLKCMDYETMQLIVNEINSIIPIFGRDGFVAYLRKSLLKEIAVAIGDSLEKFGFIKLIPVTIDEKSGALLFHGRAFRSLSGGEKTIAAILLRVLYAKLLAPSMRLYMLMLDEPTADLDSIRVGYLRQMLSRIANVLGMQVIVVTHDEQVIPDNANQIVINSQIR